MEKGNYFVYKPVFSVPSSVASQICMNIKLHIASKLLKVFLLLWDVVGSLLRLDTALEINRCNTLVFFGKSLTLSG